MYDEKLFKTHTYIHICFILHVYDEKIFTVPYLTSNTPQPNLLYLAETAQEK